MQATSCHLIPSKFPSPKLPPHVDKLPISGIVPRAVSITAPPSQPPRQHKQVLPLDMDDTVTAFWDYQFLFMSQRSETLDPITLSVAEGAIPSDFPSGTYYLTGPGLFSDDHGSTVHPLDGHGYLRAFQIDGNKGEAKFMARYIKTDAKVEEHDSATDEWKFTHRGPFSVLKGGKKLGNTKVMKNVANTSVLIWGGRLFCLWEGGQPYEIDPSTLDTIGRFDLIDGCDLSLNPEIKGVGGFWDLAAEMLKPILYGVFNMPPKRLLSHYKIDSQRNRLLIMSCNAEDMLLPQSNFTFYEFDSNLKMLQKKEFNIPDHLMIHDWAFTENYYILFGNRIKLDIAGSMTAVCGLSPMISALSLNPNKPTSPIYLLPRFPTESTNANRDWKVPIEAPSQMWVLHCGNAFEEKDRNGNVDIQIQASGCSYQWFNFQKMFGYDWKTGKLDPSMMNVKEKEKKLVTHLVQVSIQLDTSGNCQKCGVKPLNKWDKSSDFPVINQNFSGSKNSYVYAATTSGSRQSLQHFPFDTVVKLNTVDESVSTWSVGNRRFIGEPIFVPKGTEEGEGYLLVVEYAVSTQRCYLVILDPKRIGMANALLAKLEVPRHLNFPLGFHGFWADSNPLN
ncbi:Carotenoid cleavage dioxygenase 7 [Heracleum sosnowskyi]|uniref:Carotenoid cleavage dioxygenase 7 n=1 Tax=Heracleum sosnowskyi TaxID=360622 RepID=A0AAD8N3X3_9APIA|nr:Carotenoid cleavage dioxygenase 7 [Heracleum sosnowskyi]